LPLALSQPGARFAQRDFVHLDVFRRGAAAGADLGEVGGQDEPTISLVSPGEVAAGGNQSQRRRSVARLL